MPKKGPKERGYGEACAVGSCFESSSTKWDLDFAESSPNGPKWTREWLKAVSPKNSKTVEREGLSAPKPNRREARLDPHLCLSIVLAKRPEKRKKRLGLPTAPRHPVEEKDVATSTRFLVTLRHLRRLGDAPTYKTHQGNGERAKKRKERGRRRRGKGAHRQGGIAHGNGEEGEPLGA